MLSRRNFIKLTAVVPLVVAGVSHRWRNSSGGAPSGGPPPGGPPPGGPPPEVRVESAPNEELSLPNDIPIEVTDDALTQRVLSELAVFTNWLDANNVKGIVSEVGWPGDRDVAEWSALAERWYQAADAAGLWVIQFTTGAQSYYGSDPYKMLVYRRSGMSWPDGGIDTVGTQAPVLEAHLSTPTYRRGITVAGGDWSDTDAGDSWMGEPPTFSNANPGTYGADWPTGWRYETQASFDFLASRDIDTVRVGFKWERLQPSLWQELQPTELQRIKAVVEIAGNVGIGVILDLHDYGDYYAYDGGKRERHPLGSHRLPVSAFENVWGRLAREFSGDPRVIAYGLMNEPHDLNDNYEGLTHSSLWEHASQRATMAIRSTGDTKMVHVPGYGWSHVQVWTTHHPAPWITDPADNFLYDAHHYWDRDHSASYALSYAEEVLAAQT